MSGAVLLLPFQVSVLGVPRARQSLPTNLLYNVIATPGALYRYWRQRQTGGRLALLLVRRNHARGHGRIGNPIGCCRARASSTWWSPPACTRSAAGWL